MAERDAMIANAWKDREGSLANTEFEEGKPEEGFRRNVVRRCQPHACRLLLISQAESEYFPIYMTCPYYILSV